MASRSEEVHLRGTTEDVAPCLYQAKIVRSSVAVREQDLESDHVERMLASDRDRPLDRHTAVVWQKVDRLARYSLGGRLSTQLSPTLVRSTLEELEKEEQQE